jgi:DNA-binding transcriptional MerR regulator
MFDAHDTLKPKEARELLGVSRTWLHTHSEDGMIPSWRIGPDGPRRYSRRALMNLLVHQGAQESDE